MARSALLLLVSLFACALPAAAQQRAYVLDESARTVSAYDLQSSRFLGRFGTKSSPRDLAVSRDGSFAVVAARNDVSYGEAPAFARKDLELQLGGDTSTAVAISNDDRFVYLAQMGIAGRGGDDYVWEIDLLHWSIQDCLGNEGQEECPLASGAQYRFNLDIRDPLFLTVCPDDSVYVVGAEGEVGRLAPGANGFALLAVSPPPEEPRGMDCTPQGVVVISSQRGAPITLIDPGPSPAVRTWTGFTVTDVGGVAVDPRRFVEGYTLVLADRGTGELLQLSRGSVIARTRPNDGSTPWNVDVAGSGLLVSANRGPGSLMALRQGWYQQPFGIAGDPLDAGVAGVVGPDVAADPYELQWIYRSQTSWLNQPKRMTIESSGTSAVRIQQVSAPSWNFRIVADGCTGRVLAVGQSCAVDVDFRPGAAPGNLVYVLATYRSHLRVQHDGSAGVSDFPLEGVNAATVLQTTPVFLTSPFRNVFLP